VEVDKAFYSVPPEYVGRRLWVRWDPGAPGVRVFNDQWEQLAVHAKAEPGRFHTCAEHIPKEKFSALEDWGKLIGDVPAATAILDRFLEHAEILRITGKSYRLRNRAQSAAESAAESATAEPTDKTNPRS